MYQKYFLKGQLWADRHVFGYTKADSTLQHDVGLQNLRIPQRVVNSLVPASYPA